MRLLIQTLCSFSLLLLAPAASDVDRGTGCDVVDDECVDSASFIQLKHGLSTLSNHRKSQEYFWPSGRGPIGNYGVSPYAAKRDISSPTWSWQDERGRWANIPIGTTIDHEKNIYVTLADGMKKFSPDGDVIWTYKRSIPTETHQKAASLFDGAAYCITTAGRAYALDMETGKEIWSTNASARGDGNYGQVSAHDGVVIASSDAIQTAKGESDSKVFGFNATDGSILWTYSPEVTVWNFAASFPGDGTFVFQDLEGRAHRNWVNNGSLIWKHGGLPGSWTDGQATVGPNGAVYAVAVYGMIPTVEQQTNHTGPTGVMQAFKLSDGTALWTTNITRPPNDVPVVGKLAGRAGYSVVIPTGQQCAQGEQIFVHAYDAETGEHQWSFDGEKQVGMAVAGDIEGIKDRNSSGIQMMTMPNPWGQAAIDANGVVFIGGETGHFYSLRDANGDGKVDGADSEEVSRFETKAAWVGSSGPAIAPGLMAVGDQGTLHVYRWNTTDK